MSVSAHFDGAAVTLFDGSRSRSRALLRHAGMGIGYQREITSPVSSFRPQPAATTVVSAAGSDALRTRQS